MSTEPPEPPNAPVGYKSPPKHSRFKKGQSGNPSGKRKGKPQFSLAEIFLNVLAEPIQVTKKGKSFTVTAYEALVRQTVQAAIKGDSTSRKDIFKQMGQLQAKSAGADDETIDEKEEQALEEYIARRLRAAGEHNG